MSGSCSSRPRRAPTGVAKVALAVDPDDALIDMLTELPLDMIQLHGSESPERVAEIGARTGLPIMKAIGVRKTADLDAVARYAPVAAHLLVDARPPPGATRPGGNALAFDWRLVAGRHWPVPWMLAGGLTASNVAEAVRLTGVRRLDVSSGVERTPGKKDPAKIEAFIRAANRAGKERPQGEAGSGPGPDAASIRRERPLAASGEHRSSFDGRAEPT